MPGFNAATVVEPLDYDFRTTENPKAPHGVIKEPTDRQLADYLAGIKKLLAKFKGQLPESLLGGDVNPVDLFNAMDDLDPEVVVNFHADMAGLFAELCSGDPSKADILGLPIRVRAIFYAWLQQEVMSPEAAPGAGSGQVVTMPRAAAG